MIWAKYLVILAIGVILVVSGNIHYFKGQWSNLDTKYGSFPESQRLEMLEEARKMFYFGYDNYMKYAFPKDELDPVHCVGRGPDYDNPSNININDVLGDYALTLIDTLDTLAVMGNSSEFKRAVKLVVEQVSFDTPNTVQVFEATIRVLGALLSAHLIVIDPNQPFGDMTFPGYDNELLHLAHDLAVRLVPAFTDTATGIPHPRVNLQSGVPLNCLNETCLSGAGTMLLEFGMLSRLLSDPVYESLAGRAVERLWSFRSNVTGLFGNVINIQTGEWIGRMSGIGAGLDSFYEYLLKAYILFGETSLLKKFNESYETIKYYMRRGRKHCNDGAGFTPIYVNVNMRDGEMVNNWIDSLQASWPSVQVLIGDIDEAICAHALFYSIWQRYGALPERYNWHLKAPDINFYPLRPELVESTYLLYQATKNPFYLHVGRDILQSLNNYTKAECGYATIHDVKKMDLEDRMESFFLSETCKYLYLLFDKDNHLNKQPLNYIFTTEGHVFPLNKKYVTKPWDSEHFNFASEEKNADRLLKSRPKPSTISDEQENRQQTGDSTIEQKNINFTACSKISDDKKYFLPIKSRYLQQLESLVGLN